MQPFGRIILSELHVWCKICKSYLFHNDDPHHSKKYFDLCRGKYESFRVKALSFKKLSQGEFYFYFKYGLIYREVLHIKPFDWCQCMLEPTLNPTTKFMLNLLNESAIGLLHPCPYHDININKAPIRTSTVGGIFPSGTYKIFFNLKNEKHEDILSVLVLITNNSTNKDPFGRLLYKDARLKQFSD